jgi:serralysin
MIEALRNGMAGLGQLDAASYHYIVAGYWEGRGIDTFSGLDYAASNEDIAAAARPLYDPAVIERWATQHYVQQGYWEGRSIDAFDGVQYLENYADLQAAYGADEDLAAWHYVVQGMLEERTDDALVGGNGADSLVSEGYHDQLWGEGGDDHLVGGDGNDTLDGGDGTDRLDGQAGDDWLAGRAGADNLDGGDGNDWADYSASAVGVVVSLATGLGSAGDAAGDTLTGVEGLRGSALADALTGAAGADSFTGGGGNDSLVGGAGADSLVGGIGADSLVGSGGNDVLDGRGGADDLTGGIGADRFRWWSVTESTAAATDVLRDFSQTQGDIIDLSIIDSDAATAGNQAFAFIGSSAFFGGAAQLRYRQDGIDLLIEADTGDGNADLVIRLAGSTVTLTAADFVL